MATSSTDNPAWESALDWLLRLKAQPNDSALIADWQAWLEADPAHAAAWRKATRVWQLTGALARHKASPPAQQPAARPRRRSRVALYGSALAACLVVAVMQLLPDLQADYSSPRGETRTITLSDGSSVTLDSGAAFNSQFDASQRHIELLRGRAFFDVSHNSQRPFTVQAGSSRITVTGTAFEVAREAQQLAVTVQQGSVRVRDDLVRGPEMATDLTPGERLTLNRSSGALQRDKQHIKQIAAWRQGLLLANDTRLGDLLTTLRGRYNGLIVVRDEHLLSRRVTGVFNLHEPTEALRALVKPYGGTVEAYSPWLLVVGNAAEATESAALPSSAK